VRTLADLAGVLRGLRRRQARRSGGAEPTYRELAAATGWSHGIIGEYLAGRVLPPTDRFDVLVRLLGATPAEQGALATARDRVEEQRRQALVQRGTRAGDGREASDASNAPAGRATVRATEPTAAMTVPRQLPGDVYGFTGRGAALTELDGLLAPQKAPDAANADSKPTAEPSATARSRAAPAAEPPSPTIAVIAGTAGVGKTALAIRWAHRVAPRFPDGQLHVDLRGYGPEQPLAPADALARFLRALGVDGTAIPAAEDERAAVYRTLLADRRMLVLLDNAGDADQVRPLIPGSGSCFLLVTSRDALAGLVARDGARRIVLDRLGTEESATLLRTLVGPRADAEPDAVAELARRCTHLPLALRIAAELATAQPHTALADLAAELGDEPRRLDSLDAAGDPRTAARAVFSWSLRHLTPRTARAFALLGLHPGPDVDPHALAALADCPLSEARALLSELIRAHLVESAGPDRGRLHDLLRAYAAELADEDQAVVGRLFDHYLHAAGTAMDTLFPHESRTRPPLTACDTPTPTLATREAASQWLDRERPNLVALALHAARHGRPDHGVALSGILWRAFEVSGHYQEALAVHTAAAEATLNQIADPTDQAAYGRADVLANLGGAHWWTGQHRRAREYFEQSLAEHPAPHGRARALARLAVVHERLGDYPAAAACLAEALGLHRSLRDRHGEGAQLINLGALHRRLGRLAEAAECQREATSLFAELGDGRLEGYALGNLAVVEALLGRHGEALAHLERALSHCRAAGDRGGEGSALGTMGLVHRLAGDHPRALDHLRRALELHQGTGERSLETETLNGLGETLLAMGEPDAALERHEAALVLARQTADRFEEARALDGIGCAYAASGLGSEARRHWLSALSIFGPLGVPDAEHVRVRLAGESG
jgi:tetratricopeptide (TPR) repeat protein